MTKALISAILLVVPGSLSVSLSQGRKELNKPTLSVFVRSAESSYSITEDIRLDIELQNVGEQSQLLCRSWGWGAGRTDVRVFDTSGKEVVAAFFADQIPPTPRENDFVELKPNEFFGIRLRESATHFVNTPGRYDILVEYTAPVSEEWARKYVRLPRVALWSRERGTITSNRVRIEVTK